MDLFLFDMAGTTIRDDGFVLRAFLAAAKSEGLTPEPQWVRARMGWKKLRVFELMLQAAGRSLDSAPSLNERFEEQIAVEVSRHAPEPLPGAVEAMRALRKAGAEVGFTTGFSEKTACLLLRLLGWPADVLAASDMVDEGRPAPDLIRYCMGTVGVSDAGRVGVAGDTPADLQAGAAAGCGMVVGVGHGSHSLEELAAFPHTHLLPDLKTLPEILDVVA